MHLQEGAQICANEKAIYKKLAEFLEMQSNSQ